MILAICRGVRYARNLSRGKRVSPERPFSLVLSGGGLKGLAHIGVLRALEERGLVPSLVVGSSIGSLIGAAWAAGVPLRQMEARARAGAAAGHLPGRPHRRRIPPPAGPRALPARAAGVPGPEPRRRRHLPRPSPPPAGQHGRSPFRHAGPLGPARPAGHHGRGRSGGLLRPARHLPASGHQRPLVRGRRGGGEPPRPPCRLTGQRPHPRRQRRRHQRGPLVRRVRRVRRHLHPRPRDRDADPDRGPASRLAGARRSSWCSRGWSTSRCSPSTGTRSCSRRATARPPRPWRASAESSTA